MPQTALVTAKYIVVLFIIITTFTDLSTFLAFLNNKTAKVLMLLATLCVMYYDLHLGILSLIAYFMIILQINSRAISDLHVENTNGTDLSDDSKLTLESQNNTKQSYSKIVDEQAPSCENKKKAVTNAGILDYNLDPKVSPFKSYIMNMTSAEQLEKASNDAFLQA